MVKTLGETGGLGTVATRADIIEKLFNSFLMEKRGNEIHLTGKARQLLSLVPEDLKKPGADRRLGDETVQNRQRRNEAGCFYEGDRCLHQRDCGGD